MKVGGDRQPDGSVKGLSGATLSLHAAGTANSGTSVAVQGIPGARHDAAWSWTTCVSDSDGDCSFVIPIRDGGLSETGVPEDTRFWVVQESAPPGWYTNPSLRLGGFGVTPEYNWEYRFRTDARLRAGETYESTTPLAASPNWSASTEADRGFMREREDTNSEGGMPANIGRTTGAWSQSRVNPAFPAQCDLTVALVTDTSGSLGGPGMAEVKSAMSTFVDSFRGTPTQMSLFSFSESSPGAGASNHPALLPVTTAADAAVFKNQFANWLPGGGTNWEQGLAAAANSGNSYDLVVFLTDGNPTTVGTAPRNGSSAFNSFRDVDAGVFSANQLKASGARVVAIGAGSAIQSEPSAKNLRAISGTVENVDFFRTENFSEAALVLSDIALLNCQGGISVEKMIVPTGGTIADATAAPEGWEFNAASVTSGVGLTSVHAVTGDNGTVNFGLTFTDPVHSGDVEVLETQKPGYEIFPVGVGAEARNAVCENSETGASLLVENAGDAQTPGFIVEGATGVLVSCTIYNTIPAAPGIQVVKRINGDDANSAPGVSVAPGSSMKITFDVTNTGNVPLSDVIVADDVIGAADIDAPATWDGSLAVGETVTFTATLRAPAAGGKLHTNIATVTGESPTGADVTDDDKANATTTPAVGGPTPGPTPGGPTLTPTPPPSSPVPAPGRPAPPLSTPIPTQGRAGTHSTSGGPAAMELARTGGDISTLVAAASLTLCAGVALEAAAWRRRRLPQTRSR